jgi:rhodanese-related sulfurtransferase
MNDPLQLGRAPASGVPEIPDLDRPMQIAISNVKAFFDAKAGMIVDARDPVEYADGHIPGAVNLPYDQVITDPERLEKFDAQGKPIIVYCGGGTCELSMNLGFAMVNAGKKKVLVYMGGWPEWASSGYPIARAQHRRVRDGDAGLSSSIPRCGAARSSSPGSSSLPRRFRRSPTFPAFAGSVHNFHLEPIIPIAATNLLAMTIPWIELVAGLALVAGRQASCRRGRLHDAALRVHDRRHRRHGARSVV